MTISIAIELDKYLFRWAGSSFVAVWEAARAPQHVPDDMIPLPPSLKKSSASRDDIKAVCQRWLDERHPPTRMRSEAEVRAELARLETLREVRTEPFAAAALATQIEMLRWVLTGDPVF